MEWISVQDRFPEDKEEVLIYANGWSEDMPHIFAVAEYDEQTKEFDQYDWVCDEYILETANVTHWMPLPKPPVSVPTKTTEPNEK